MLERVLEELNVVVLTREERLAFSFPESFPSWFSEILSQGKVKDGLISFEDELSFVGTFLPDALNHWKDKSAGSFRFPLLDVVTPEGVNETIELLAMCCEDKDYLIARPRLAFEERRVIQTARENLLSQEKLSAYVDSLEGEARENLQLLEGFPDLVLRCNQAGEVIKVISSKTIDAVPNFLSELVPERLLGELEESLNSQWAASVLDYRREDRDFELRMVPLNESDHLVVERDVSQSKRMEREIVKARTLADQASQAKSDFLASVSHEIRTPMNGVIGMADLLLLSELDKEKESQVGIIKQSANSLLTLINDLLDLSKIEAGKFDVSSEAVNLVEIIEQVSQLLFPKAESKGLTCELSFLKDEDIWVQADPVRTRQILINLVANAIKFTNSGSINISVEARDSEKTLRILVRDTGKGIADEQLGKVFESYSQIDSTSAVGTGLGLPICKRLIKLMNGQMGVESRLGSGSTFWFDLPRSQDLVKPKVEVLNKKKLSSYSGKVLVVEDNLVNQKVAKGLLGKFGLNVEIAGDGEAAVLLVEKGSYDLIFMDCGLPGIDGYEATKVIRDSGVSKPIVALTADAGDSTKERCLDAGMNDFVSKPISLESLDAVLSNWLA